MLIVCNNRHVIVFSQNKRLLLSVCTVRTVRKLPLNLPCFWGVLRTRPPRAVQHGKHMLYQLHHSGLVLALLLSLILVKFQYMFP